MKIALQNGVTLKTCIHFVKEARFKGLTIPVVLMGYFNPFYIFGEERLMIECKNVGVNGFIVWNLYSSFIFILMIL